MRVLQTRFYSLKVTLNLYLSTAKLLVKKPCVQLKQVDVALEQSYCESNLGQWELKLLDNSPAQVRAQKDINVFVADVLAMHSKKEQLFYAQQ